ncbi:MAG TPA: pyruvate dehydrogenase (acetyl-transferring) E1 component subunit alpha [Myxococcaceae bacterium]|nr:pyruvate dehydrogenase (acetyl-transferring) E1 component subunit alpha [Myxococcaceae bacterium]
MSPDAPRAFPLARDEALAWLRQMQLIRRFEEASAQAYSAGKIRGFLHLYIGEEACAVGAIRTLQPDDALVSHYREHGHALARGLSARAIMAEMFGKAEGCSRGRGGSMHLFDASRRFYGGNAIVAGGLPLAVGLALADQMLKQPRVTVAIFGDGAVAEGEFHESLNLATLWKLPVLFLCENNLYAMGTALARHEAQPELTVKAASYGLPAESADGMDALAVADAVGRAAARARAGEGPSFVELRTYRFRAHSMYDPELYRDKREVEAWKQRDPIIAFIARMREAGLLSEGDLERLEREVDAEVEDALAFAEAGTLEPVEALTRDVYTPKEVR